MSERVEGGCPSLELEVFCFKFSISKASIRKFCITELLVNTSEWLHIRKVAQFSCKGEMRLTVRSRVRIEEYIETVSASILFQFSRVPLHKCKFFKAYKDYHFSGKISLRQTGKKSHPLQQLPNVKFLLQILNNYSPGSKEQHIFFWT